VRRLRFAVCVAVAVLCVGCGGGQRSTGTATQAVEASKAPAGAPKGVMLIFPGGAWLAAPEFLVASTRHYRERYAALGWLAVDVGYRPGRRGFADVVRAYDSARRRQPGVPICAVGESSGGHLALMLATIRSLDCVEAVDAPTDLTRGLAPSVHKAAVLAFGTKGLARWSPALQADRIHGRVLILQARSDRLVPLSQALELKRALPSAKLIVLPPGRLAFIHETRVDRGAYRDYLLAERAFLRSL
jgi:acetyl esterase/lipase